MDSVSFNRFLPKRYKFALSINIRWFNSDNKKVRKNYFFRTSEVPSRIELLYTVLQTVT